MSMTQVGGIERGGVAFDETQTDSVRRRVFRPAATQGGILGAHMPLR